MTHSETVTCTLTVPDGYELAPGPQPRVPTSVDKANDYRLLTAKGEVTSFGSSERYYFILRKAPIGTKLVFEDVRRFTDVPKNGTYGCRDGHLIGTFTCKKASDNTYYPPPTLEQLVSYYTEEPLYAS